MFVQVPGNAQRSTFYQFSSKLALPGLDSKRIYQDEPIPAPPAGITPPSLHVEKSDKSFTVTATWKARSPS